MSTPAYKLDTSPMNYKPAEYKVITYTTPAAPIQLKPTVWGSLTTTVERYQYFNEKGHFPK